MAKKELKNHALTEKGDKKSWTGTTFGSGWMHRWLIGYLRGPWVLVWWLYIFEAVFIIPVCLFVNPGGRLLYHYFRRRQGYGRWKSAWKTYVNHYLFGQVVIDKFAMYAGKQFHITVDGYDYFKALARKPEAFVQLSSHIGNYEVAGYTLDAEDKRLNALVFFGEKESVMENRKKMFAHTNISMIPIRPDGSHVFEINDVLQRGETVSMPADRVFGSSRTLKKMVLGAEADLPLGPFSIATMRGLEVLAVNVMKDGLRSYHIYVTPLPYDKSAERREQMRQLSDAYVTELERMMKLYPEQWYNYFDFWGDN